MSGVKRYYVSGYGGGMIEREDGAWVHVDDHAALEAERDALRAQVEAFRVALESIASIEDELYGGDWEEIELARDIAGAALQAKP